MRKHPHNKSKITARGHMQRARTVIRQRFLLKNKEPMPKAMEKTAKFLLAQIDEAFGFQAKKMTIAIPEEELNRGGI